MDRVKTIEPMAYRHEPIFGFRSWDFVGSGAGPVKHACCILGNGASDAQVEFSSGIATSIELLRSERVREKIIDQTHCSCIGPIHVVLPLGLTRLELCLVQLTFVFAHHSNVTHGSYFMKEYLGEEE